jgi:tRNA (adenine22-N1)-methyltransferase
MVPQGAQVADIGTDHALLPCYLIREKIAARVIGVEIKKGPYQRANLNISNYNLSSEIELRLGDGLTVLKPREVDTVILAGMGGSLICRLLEAAPQIVTGLKQIIVQPMNRAKLVRFWLAKEGWFFEAEDLLEENNYFYQIIKVGKKGAEINLSNLTAAYGPLLLTKKHPLLINLIETDLKRWQEIVGELAKANSKVAKKRAQVYQKRIQQLKKLLDCLKA